MGRNGEKEIGTTQASKNLPSQLRVKARVAVNNQSDEGGWAKTLIVLGVGLRFMVGVPSEQARKKYSYHRCTVFPENTVPVVQYRL